MEKGLSRRNLLRQLTGGVVTAAIPALARGGVLLAENSRGSAGPISLSRNENAYGPSTKVVAAMQQAAAIAANRYPVAETEALRTKIAALHDVAPAQVVLGCGSTDIMRMAVEAFLVPGGGGKKLIVALPTADVISGFASRAGAEVVSVPLAANRAHDLSAMLARTDVRTGLVYICNPNNPTGTLTPRREIEAFVRSLPATCHVVIDEAYHHYVGKPADYASFIDRPIDDHRIIVTRSFSNIHGLAGLRVGYAIAAARTAPVLGFRRLPDGVNVVAARATLAALDDISHIVTSARRNADDRQEFRNQANARMVRTIDSQTNFVMIEAGPTATDVVRHFREHDIALPHPFPSFDRYVRVSLGTPAQMHEFWRVWDLVPRQGMSQM
ncbi:MAG TPA: aminotransferase class I/II-fold pyridoxal phosphate-dependent enzyme [Gemmatimonadaceae bacterium]|nr:aminotransferase class I/II-fold pyridoxal phosphate-dependent enzyme [Gemmatimonadaceae bacterium]